MAFDDYLSDQGKSKSMWRTPFQDTVEVSRIRKEMFDGPGCCTMPKEGDWERLRNAERKAEIAEQLFRNGTYER